MTDSKVEKCGTGPSISRVKLPRALATMCPLFSPISGRQFDKQVQQEKILTVRPELVQKSTKVVHFNRMSNELRTVFNNRCLLKITPKEKSLVQTVYVKIGLS